MFDVITSLDKQAMRFEVRDRIHLYQVLLTIDLAIAHLDTHFREHLLGARCYVEAPA